jgi:hypothetical protein
MKEWRCIVIGHHEDVARVITEWELQGWHLHTYNTAGMGGAWNYTVNHYLLFVRGE